MPTKNYCRISSVERATDDKHSYVNIFLKVSDIDNDWEHCITQNIEIQESQWNDFVMHLTGTQLRTGIRKTTDCKEDETLLVDADTIIYFTTVRYNKWSLSKNSYNTFDVNWDNESTDSIITESIIVNKRTLHKNLKLQ